MTTYNSIKKDLLNVLDNLIVDSSPNNYSNNYLNNSNGNYNKYQIGGNKYSESDINNMLMSTLQNIMGLYEKKILKQYTTNNTNNDTNEMNEFNQLGGGSKRRHRKKYYTQKELDDIMTKAIGPLYALYMQLENEKRMLMNQLQQLQSRGKLSSLSGGDDSEEIDGGDDDSGKIWDSAKGKWTTISTHPVKAFSGLGGTTGPGVVIKTVIKRKLSDISKYLQSTYTNTKTYAENIKAIMEYVNIDFDDGKLTYDAGEDRYKFDLKVGVSEITDKTFNQIKLLFNDTITKLELIDGVSSIALVDNQTAFNAAISDIGGNNDYITLADKEIINTTQYKMGTDINNLLTKMLLKIAVVAYDAIVEKDETTV